MTDTQRTHGAPGDRGRQYPAAIDVGDVVDAADALGVPVSGLAPDGSAPDIRPAPGVDLDALAARRRRVIPLDAIAEFFALLSDVTGKPCGPELMRVYRDHFTALGLTPATIIRTARELVLSWDKPYWPSPEHCEITARKIERAAGAGSGAAERFREMDDASRANAVAEYDRRQHAAEAWFDANPRLGNAMIRAVDRDVARLAKNPDGPLARKTKFRKAFRHAAVVSHCLRQLAIGHTIAGRRESSELLSAMDNAADRNQANQAPANQAPANQAPANQAPAASSPAASNQAVA